MEVGAFAAGWEAAGGEAAGGEVAGGEAAGEVAGGGWENVDPIWFWLAEMVQKYVVQVKFYVEYGSLQQVLS